MATRTLNASLIPRDRDLELAEAERLKRGFDAFPDYMIGIVFHHNGFYSVKVTTTKGHRRIIRPDCITLMESYGYKFVEAQATKEKIIFRFDRNIENL